jgi:hypothetical protein
MSQMNDNKENKDRENNKENDDENDDRSKMLSIIGDWMIRYRKMCPNKSDKKHVSRFLLFAKSCFEEKSTSYVCYKNIFNYSNWENDWMPLASSFYLTYTLW